MSQEKDYLLPSFIIFLVAGGIFSASLLAIPAMMHKYLYAKIINSATGVLEWWRMGGTAYAAPDDTGYFGSGYIFDENAASKEEIDKILKGTPFDKDNLGEDLGEAIIAAAEKYHLNPVYITAHAFLETGRGVLSPIARDKKNIFGFMAYDRDPYGSAMSFSNYQEGVEYVMGYIKNEYLTPGGKWYEGETLEAMNKHYATDETWAFKIRNIMIEIYQKIGKTPPALA